MKILSLAALSFLCILATGCNLKKDPEIIQIPDTNPSLVESEPPAGTLNNETGNVDQEAFEAQQEVSPSDDLSDLEAEINNTVILEEDFSDL